MYCPNFIKAGGSNPTYCPDFIRVMSMQNMGYDNQTFGLKVLFESKGSSGQKYSSVFRYLILPARLFLLHTNPPTGVHMYNSGSD